MKSRLDGWQLRTEYTLVEAALLITENYPDDFLDASNAMQKQPNDFLITYGQLLIDATEVINERAYNEDEGKYYIEYELNTDKPQNVIKLSHAEGFNIRVEKYALLKYIEAKGLSVRFFTDETLISRKAISESTRKSDNLLKALAAIAIDDYGYDPKAIKSSAPDDIAKALASNGVSFDVKTIRGWLKEGAELLEPSVIKS